MLKFTRKDNVAYWRKYPQKTVWDWPESYESIRTVVGTDALDPHIALREHWLIQCEMPNGKMQNVGIIQEAYDRSWFVRLDWSHTPEETLATFEDACSFAEGIFALDNLYPKYVEVNEDIPF